ncbi:MAG: putative Aminotransferase [Deltaproteobacteria bacterium]|nr:putative Aminotransferase [Deltaproteobacteria bacterium]
MRVRRTLPPAAVPLDFQDLWNGFKGFLAGESYDEKLKEEIRRYFNVKHVFLTSSGKASLYLMLMALKFLRPQKREVIIPAYTCFSVPSAIVRAGLTVVPCDIDASSLDFDRNILKNRTTNKTLCVVPNHLFGVPSRMDDIIEMCRGRDVFVLEDAAQAMGSGNGEKFLGTIGDAGFFSLGRGKAVTCGSGGIIMTNSDTISAAIQNEYDRIPYPRKTESLKELAKAALMSLFIRPYLYWIPAAIPFLKLGRTVFDPDFPVQRLSSMQAGLCATWRRRLEKAMSIRKRQAAQLCSQLKIAGPLNSSCVLPYLRFPVIVESRVQKRRICEAAAKKGLGITQMYPSPINEIPQIAHCFRGHSFPGARLVADRLITMPLHQFVNDRDRAEMVRLIAWALRARRRDSMVSGDLAMPIPHLVAKGRGQS